ncbi:NAD(P)H-dependent oxidoreductase [Sediminitomix flava]|uniref:Putative NADPH-quinone reductase n=1 Tax=Sediminitomix flava TaxID=379075 RepID=A0A315ZC27_SEDFL|nr:NAD(P)H-dependent oxidoreductase [Sediminitomix flava]PWJ42862.1 putative NADPH-quinone reductase [Sediminitomix flava]
MKILHLVFHPNLENSRVNKTWKEQLQESGKVTTSRDMYKEYPDFKIDVEKEQELLLAHDRIVIQFPLYWYSMTPLLKQWLDDVLTYNFAYGSKGIKLKDKELQIILSAGGSKENFSGFDKFCTIYDLLKPFELTANLTKMKYLVPVWMYRADAVSEEIIKQYGQKWVEIIDDPKRSNPIESMNEQMDSETDEFYEQLS